MTTSTHTNATYLMASNGEEGDGQPEWIPVDNEDSQYLPGVPYTEQTAQEALAELIANGTLPAGAHIADRQHVTSPYPWQPADEPYRYVIALGAGPVIAVEEFTDIDTGQITITDTRTWGEETYSYGVTNYGSDVVVIESPTGTEVFALNSREEAEQYRDLQLAGSMIAADGEITFRAGPTLDDDTVAVREDASNGTRYSVVRVGDRVEITEWDAAYPDAIEDACEKAVQLADRLAHDADEINYILGLHMHTQIHEHRARAARYRTGEAVRQAKFGGIIGRTGQITVVDLAHRLGVSRQVLTNVIADQDWVEAKDSTVAGHEVRSGTDYAVTEEQ